MGYEMSMKECKFTIKRENQNSALNALKEFTNGKQFRWVDSDVIQKSINLKVALVEIRYDATFDYDNNIVDLEFIGEKLGDDTELFNCIAPFVEDGSYIEMVGEDGDRWRWVFSNDKCEWVDGIVSWKI